MTVFLPSPKGGYDGLSIGWHGMLIVQNLASSNETTSLSLLNVIIIQFDSYEPETGSFVKAN